MKKFNLLIASIGFLASQNLVFAQVTHTASTPCQFYQIVVSLNDGFRQSVNRAIDWTNYGSDRGICTYLGAAKGQIDQLVSLTQNYRGLWTYGRPGTGRGTLTSNSITLNFAARETQASLHSALRYCVGLGPDFIPGISTDPRGNRSTLLSLLGQSSPNPESFDITFFHTVTSNSDSLKEYVQFNQEVLCRAAENGGEAPTPMCSRRNILTGCP